MRAAEGLRSRERLSRRADPANAWRPSLDRDGQLTWLGNEGEYRAEPGASPFTRLEEELLGALPMEGQMQRRVSLAAPASGTIIGAERRSTCRG